MSYIRKSEFGPFTEPIRIGCGIFIVGSLIQAFFQLGYYSLIPIGILIFFLIKEQLTKNKK